MATDNITGIHAQVELQPLKADNGCMVMLMKWEADYYRARGIRKLTLTVELDPSQAVESWLTVTDAAQMYINEEIVFGLSLKDARSRVSEACGRGLVTHRGKSTSRRIEPGSFRRWLLDRRRHENDADR